MLLHQLPLCFAALLLLPLATVSADESESTPSKVRNPSAADGGPLSPAEAAKAFDVEPGFRWEQVLSEPEIAQPVFLNFDERGRMWVVEYRQYPSPAGLKVLSHDEFWRAVYDKVPPPPPHQFRGLDRITIHESTKGDGVFDKHTVFLDGLNICTAVERGRGGVWVLNPPYLLFYKVKPGSDVPDGDPVVHLAGFGIQDTHSVANSLRWGPDGWLYGAHGSTVVSSIVRPGLDKEPIAHMEGQGIWRYQPETRRFEIFSEGGGNTFGVEIDAKGRIYSGHNGSDTRGFHYMQGAYLRKGFDKHGPLSNPYAFGFFDAMAHGKAERFTHNFLIYDGGALPPEHRGKLFACEPLQGRIVESDVKPDGASFATHDIGHPVVSRDHWFRPVDIKAGPDGAIYVCDWYDRQITHTHNEEGQIDTSNGRVYRLEGPDAKPSAPFDLAKLDGPGLTASLDSPNKWMRQTVLRVVGDRRDSSLVGALEAKVAATDGQSALEALWALNLSGGLTEAVALRCLEHRDPFVRLWTARLLCDENHVSPAILDKLARGALDEPNLEARAQLACSARRLPAEQDFAIVRNLFSHDEDAADKRLPLLLWWAIESKAESDTDRVLALFRDSSLWERPIVRNEILSRLMRRYAEPGTRKDLLTCAALLDLSPSAETSKKLMSGFEAAYQGRPLVGLPEELLQAMARHHAGTPELALRQGDPKAIEDALKVLADGKAALKTRLQYATIFGQIKAPASVPVLLDVALQPGDAALRKAAFNSLAAYDDASVAERIIGAHASLDTAVLPSAQMLLASRAGWAAQLVGAVEAKRIAAESIPRPIVRKLRHFSTQDLPSRAEKIWGPDTGATTAEMTQQIEWLTQAVHGGGGDPYKGRELFRATCEGCHTLHGEGGHVGPDLTGYNRADLATLLLNIVNPSAEIREGYENFLVTAKDGRIANGFLVEQDPKTVVLRGLDGQNITLARDEIAEMKSSGVSLMPEGLLNGLNEQQARDFFAYLQSAQPLPGK
ncbi:MAG TPA: c-type cytochrome [Chthoniobacteraceae bacterium]|jgi:putative heme-binding domain-containing protein